MFSLALLSGNFISAAETKPIPGLAVTFSAAGQKDFSTTPGVALHVEPGEPPTPFLSGGPFAAVWEGSINAELRATYSFQADLNGALKVEINGAVILDVSGAGGSSPFSKLVLLNKGVNAFKAAFTEIGRASCRERVSLVV